MRWIIFIGGYLALLIFLIVWSLVSHEDEGIIIGRKAFAESRILAEMGKHLAYHSGQTATTRQYAGSLLVWEALERGNIHIYPEYTGTLRFEILKGVEDIDAFLAARGLKMSKSLGFNNSYALGMLETVAEKKGIRNISDLAKHPDLRYGFSREFVGRADGWDKLSARYGLRNDKDNVSSFDHTITYEALNNRQIDVMDVYTTDAKIKRYNVRILKDDLKFFPGYDAVWLYRPKKIPPEALEEILRLEGAINEEEMRELNQSLSENKKNAPQAAVDFLNRKFDLSLVPIKDSWLKKMLNWALEHMLLVVISLSVAIVVAIPLGVISAKSRVWEQILLSLVGLFQTIPALAMLLFFLAIFGQTGVLPALAALFLYSLLPIVRNTHAGIKDIPASLQESAVALGLPPSARLWKVELPLASRSILAGIKTAAVINVGFATLGGFIGAGGFGEPVLEGLSRLDWSLILQGAAGSAVLALLVQGAFELVERYLSPGLSKR